MASERRSGGNLPSRGEKQSDTITAQPLGRGGKSGRGGGSETTMGENPETVEGDWTVLNFVAASSANTDPTPTEESAASHGGKRRADTNPDKCLSPESSLDDSVTGSLEKQLEDMQKTQKKLLHEIKKLKQQIKEKNDEIVRLCKEQSVEGEGRSVRSRFTTSVNSDNCHPIRPVTSFHTSDDTSKQWLKKELDDYKLHIAQLTRENAEVKEKADQKHKRIVDLENRLDQATQLQPQIEYLTIELSKCQAELESCRGTKEDSSDSSPVTDIDSYNKEEKWVKLIRMKEEEWEKRLKEKEEEWSQRVERREKKIHDLKSKIIELEKAAVMLQKVQHHSKDQSQRLLKAQDEAKAKEEEVKEVMDSLESLQEQVGNLQEKNQSLAIDRGRLKESVSTLQGQVSKLTAGREKKALDEERLRQENKSFVEQCRRLGKTNQSMKEEIHHLMKEKEELKEKLETTEAQVQIFEEDFKAEREDRERAHSQRNEQEEKFKKEVMRLQSELEHTRQQLSNHKGNLSGLENVHKERHTEWMHTMDELKKAQEEIRAKTSQVKQYKKQLDTVTAKTSSLEKEREEMETHFELLRKAAERQSMKVLIKTETKALSKKASGSQLHSEVPEQPFAAEGKKEQVGKLVVENAELQQQVSTLRAKLEKTAKKLSKADEKKKKKASTSDILVSSPVSDSDMSTELELSQVKDLCMQLHDQNDDLQAEVRTLNDVNKTLKQCYIEFSGSSVPAASTQSTKQESGAQHGGVHGAAAMKDVTEPRARSQSMFEESHGTAGKGELLSSKHASHSRFNGKKKPATVLHDSKTKPKHGQNIPQQETVSSGHPHYQHGSEVYEQQRKSPPTDQQNAVYVNESRIQAMFEEMKVRKHQQKFPESQHSASLVEANSFDLPPPMVDFSSDQPMSFPQTTMGQGRGNAGHNQDAYGGGGGGHVGGGGAGRRGEGVGAMGGGAHIQEELLRKQQQQGAKYKHQAHRDNRGGLVSLPSVSASQVAALQRQNSAGDLGQPHLVPNPEQPAPVRNNSLSTSLDTQMQEAVEYVLEDGEGRVEVTGLHAPLDPNLTCPTCQTVFRLGEIQLFRSHVSTCGSVV